MAFNDDTSPSLGGRHHLESSAPIIEQDIDDEEEEHEFFGHYRRRAKQAESTAEGQKLSAFSRRKSKLKDGPGSGDGKAGKKGKGVRTKVSLRTPPDSPKSKGTEFSGRGKAGKAGTLPVIVSPQDKLRKGNYASLIDNDFGSDEGGEEEEDADNFLLSKGHLAREKRAATISRMTPGKEYAPMSTGGGGGGGGGGGDGGLVALNPMLLEETQPTAAEKGFTTSHSASVGLSSVQAFPVHFAPPTEARFPDPNTESEPFPSFPLEGFVQQKVGLQLIPPPPPSATSASATSAILSLPPPPPSSSSSTAQVFVSQLPPPPPSIVSPVSDAPEPTPQPSLTPPADLTLSDDFRQKCSNQFFDLQPDGGLLQGEKARKFFVQSRLPMDELSKIW